MLIVMSEPNRISTARAPHERRPHDHVERLFEGLLSFRNSGDVRDAAAREQKARPDRHLRIELRFERREARRGSGVGLELEAIVGRLNRKIRMFERRKISRPKAHIDEWDLEAQTAICAISVA